MKVFVLRDGNLAPRNEWKLARIIDVCSGADDKARKLKLIVNGVAFGKRNNSMTRMVYLERHGVAILLEAERWFIMLGLVAEVRVVLRNATLRL